jgi:hypothetical protein
VGKWNKIGFVDVIGNTKGEIPLSIISSIFVTGSIYPDILLLDAIIELQRSITSLSGKDYHSSGCIRQ